LGAQRSPAASLPAVRADVEGHFWAAVAAWPNLAARLRAGRREEPFAGATDVPNFYRKPYGPGWALVGDAGYFRDPITAHGISDALREAELFTRALVDEGDAGLESYSPKRDARVKEFLDVTDHIASFEWDLERAKADHLVLSRAMNGLVKHLEPSSS